MKDHNSATDSDPQFSELLQLATHCNEESTISLSTTPEVTPTSTPISTPPLRRKRRQRQSGSGTRSPNKEKSSTPVGGGAAISKNKLLMVGDEKVDEQLEVISIPLTSYWNIEVVYMAEQKSEAEVSTV